MARFQLTYQTDRQVNLYDAQEGIYFTEDGAVECFNFMVEELQTKAKHFSVTLAELHDFALPRIKKIIRQHKQ